MMACPFSKGDLQCLFPDRRRLDKGKPMRSSATRVGDPDQESEDESEGETPVADLTSDHLQMTPAFPFSPDTLSLPTFICRIYFSITVVKLKGGYN
jgi:hypothetical protein